MIEVGRLCVKIAGRDAGKKGAVVEVINDNFVIIDGQMKRGRCNIRHLEPLQHKLELESGAAHESVVDAMKTAGVVFPVRKLVRKPKEAKAAAAPTEKKPGKTQKSAKAKAGKDKPA